MEGLQQHGPIAPSHQQSRKPKTPPTSPPSARGSGFGFRVSGDGTRPSRPQVTRASRPRTVVWASCPHVLWPSRPQTETRQPPHNPNRTEHQPTQPQSGGSPVSPRRRPGEPSHQATGAAKRRLNTTTNPRSANRALSSSPRMNRPFRPDVARNALYPRLRLGLIEPAFQAGGNGSQSRPWKGSVAR
jgi:hypothetical protein